MGDDGVLGRRSHGKVSALPFGHRAKEICYRNGVVRVPHEQQTATVGGHDVDASERPAPVTPVNEPTNRRIAVTVGSGKAAKADAMLDAIPLQQQHVVCEGNPHGGCDSNGPPEPRRQAWRRAAGIGPSTTRKTTILSTRLQPGWRQRACTRDLSVMREVHDVHSLQCGGPTPHRAPV